MIVGHLQATELHAYDRTGRGMFLFGEPGNGKISIAERISNTFGTTMWIRRVLGIDGQIIRIFDPAIHEVVHLKKGILMSDSTEQTLNVSGCIFTIRSQQADIRQGDTIGFDITLTSGEKRVIADEISIALQECMVVRRSTSSGTSNKRRDYDKKILASNLTLEAGESHSFEFTTKLPDDCRLSDGRVITGNIFTGATDGWCLYIHVDTAEYRASSRGKASSIILAIANRFARIMPNIADDAAKGLVVDRDPSKRFYLKVKQSR